MRRGYRGLRSPFKGAFSVNVNVDAVAGVVFEIFQPHQDDVDECSLTRQKPDFA